MKMVQEKFRDLNIFFYLGMKSARKVWVRKGKKIYKLIK